MTYFCTRCKLTSEDGNRWCQDVDCPAGTSARLFQNGDHISALTIVNTVRVLPASSIYAVEWNKKRYYMKVANPGGDYEGLLKREAEALRQITHSQTVRDKAGMPRWVRHPEVNVEAYGITSYRDETKVYFLMEYVEGTILYDFLLNNPQPWHKHVGWFTQTLARTLTAQHQITGTVNLNLNPDNILVYRNNSDIPQPLLLDLGLLFPLQNESGETSVLLRSDEERRRRFTLAAYSSPVLASGGAVSARDDIFSIGLIAYEMLAGRPVYPYLGRTEEAVRDEIYHEYIPPLNRTDLPIAPMPPSADNPAAHDTLEMRRMVRRALSRDSSGEYQQYPSILAFYNDVLRLYGAVPMKTPLRIWLMRIGAAALVIILGILVLLLVWSMLSALLQAASP